jgi:hypothetical protein
MIERTLIVVEQDSQSGIDEARAAPVGFEPDSTIAVTCRQPSASRPPGVVCRSR